MDCRKTFNRIILIAWSTIAVILVMWSIALHTTEANSLFKPPVNYQADDGPFSIAIGDLNGDDDLDLAVGNYESKNVSVMLGKGDGTFKNAVNYSVGGAAFSVAIGDLDGDGDLDMAVTNDDGYVSVLLGMGDGTFQSAVDYKAGVGSWSVAIGDLNVDGAPDLAVADWKVHGVFVLLGKGDGTFQTAVKYDTVDQAHDVAIGHLNEEGTLDLAVANEGPSVVSVLLGNGDGTFQDAVTYNTGTFSTSVAIGYLNEDGHLDLAVANHGTDYVSVLLGNGDGTFQATVNYQAGDGPISVAIGDLNGDSDLDLAVVNDWSENLSVLLGNGDGTFQGPVDYDIGPGNNHGHNSLVIGDFNEDGGMDLAVTNTNNDHVTILINTGGAIVNDLATFNPDTSTYKFTPDITDCQAGAVGKFTFDATLSNISEKKLSNLHVEVDELANNNLLLTDNGLIGEGESFEVPNSDDYTDGLLSPNEYVDVPFTVCLKIKKPFRFFVNVFGVAEDIDLEKGLIAYYPFNGNANDESGNGHHGTVLGATLTEDRFGNEDSAYSFDGVNDIVNLGSPQALDDLFDGAHDFTFSAWYILEDTLTYRTLFTKGNIGDCCDYSGVLAFTYDMFVGAYAFEIYDDHYDNGLLKEWSTSDFPLNTWVLFALVYVSNSHEGEVYINGQKLSGSYFHTGYDGSVIENILNEEFKIGGEFINSNIVWPGDHYWKGLIDDIRIYNRVLSEAEINALFNLGE